VPSDRENVHPDAPLPPSALWAVRDNRTLSARAKLAYIMLWTRGKGIHPSMRTLAGDMGVSVRTARDAVRDLEAAGALITAPRKTQAGDPDSNSYELLSVLGEADSAGRPAESDRRGPADSADKDRTLKVESEGRNSLAPRHGRPAVLSDDDKIASVERAVIVCGWDPDELDDESALDIWSRFIGERVTTAPVADPVKYLLKTFSDHVSLDGVLSNTAERDAS